MFSLENHYAFQANDIYISHLLAITHKISFSFDSNYEIMDVLLNISELFDKVWYEECHNYSQSAV